MKLRSVFYNLQYFDFLFFSYINLLIFYGFILIYSVTGAEDLSRVKTQGIALVIGMVFFIFFTVINYRLLASFSWVLYLLSIILLGLLFFYGKLSRGSLSWFEIGTLHFQPSELIKFFMIIVLASFFHRFYEKMNSWFYFVFSLILVSIPIGLIFLESDMGSAVIIFLIWLGMIFFTPISFKKFAVFFIFLIFGCALAWFFMLAPYQKQRITSFLNPEQDPQGAGYNILQVLITIGSGGLTGRGLGHGPQSQLNFVPEAHTDFIFALNAEELGFLGVVVMLAIYFLLFRRMIKILHDSKERLANFIILGSIFLFIFQFGINIGMNTGLFPIVGIPLPFLSYGGSALISYLMVCGIVENIVLNKKSALF